MTCTIPKSKIRHGHHGRSQRKHLAGERSAETPNSEGGVCTTYRDTESLRLGTFGGLERSPSHLQHDQDLEASCRHVPTKRRLVIFAMTLRCKPSQPQPCAQRKDGQFGRPSRVERIYEIASTSSCDDHCIWKDRTSAFAFGTDH